MEGIGIAHRVKRLYEGHPRPFGCGIKDAGRVGNASVSFGLLNLVCVLTKLLFPSLTTGLLFHVWHINSCPIPHAVS